MTAEVTTRETPAVSPALRPTIAGTRHCISAGHYLAAEAGFQILEAGGNAVPFLSLRGQKTS